MYQDLSYDLAARHETIAARPWRDALTPLQGPKQSWHYFDETHRFSKRLLRFHDATTVSGSAQRTFLERKAILKRREIAATVGSVLSTEVYKQRRHVAFQLMVSRFEKTIQRPASAPLTQLAKKNERQPVDSQSISETSSSRMSASVVVPTATVNVVASPVRAGTAPRKKGTAPPLRRTLSNIISEATIPFPTMAPGAEMVSMLGPATRRNNTEVERALDLMMSIV